MEMTSGYLFYMNKQTGEQQNDNPQFLEIMKTVREKHKTIKYITYRCATKIWFLKQSFYSKHWLKLWILLSMKSMQINPLIHAN